MKRKANYSSRENLVPSFSATNSHCDNKYDIDTINPGENRIFEFGGKMLKINSFVALARV